MPQQTNIQDETRQVQDQRAEEPRTSFSLLGVVFIELSVHSTDAHVLHHLDTSREIHPLKNDELVLKI